MENGATPAAPSGGTPPAVPAATPPVVPTGETVTMSKAEVEQLRKDAARASSNQSDAERWRRANKNGHFKPQTPATTPSAEEAAQKAGEEDRKAERGLMALALDPSLRPLLDADPTLREMLTKNPLAVLPIYAADAFDADDAVGLVKDALTKRLLEKGTAPATPPTQPATPPATPPTAPPTGAVNPQDKVVDEAVEKARKDPNTERSIAGMIGARLKGGKK